MAKIFFTLVHLNNEGLFKGCPSLLERSRFSTWSCHFGSFEGLLGELSLAFRMAKVFFISVHPEDKVRFENCSSLFGHSRSSTRSYYFMGFKNPLKRLAHTSQIAKAFFNLACLEDEGRFECCPSFLGCSRSLAQVVAYKVQSIIYSTKLVNQKKFTFYWKESNDYSLLVIDPDIPSRHFRW